MLRIAGANSLFIDRLPLHLAENGKICHNGSEIHQVWILELQRR
ncbi:hypothetical protein [Argonema galeatum]|nr:hypothetical protein [Argonema galeatum]